MKLTRMNSPKSHNYLKKISVVTAIGALLLTGCSTGETPVDDNGTATEGFDSISPITLNIATLYGPENWQTTPMAKFTEAITEATEGKVTFEYFYAGALVPPAEMATGLRDGLIDMAHIVPVYTAAVFPYDNYINQLSFVSDPSPVAGSLQAAAATLEWGWETEEYLAEFEAEGLQPILPRLQTVHTYGMLCKEDAGILKGVEGKRVRSGGEAWSDEITNLGGVPVSMPAADAYTSFQQGLLDCMISGPEDVYALGVTDHGKSWSSSAFNGWSSAGVFFSQSSWDELPLIVKEAIWEQLPVFLEAFFTSQFETNLEFLKSGQVDGVDFTLPEEAMKSKIDAHHENVLNGIVDKAPESLGDVSTAVSSWSDLHDKWFKEITGTLGFDATPKSWAEYVEQNGEELPDLEAWAQAVYDEILAPHKPTK